jgi:hypothetical protein
VILWEDGEDAPCICGASYVGFCSLVVIVGVYFLCRVSEFVAFNASIDVEGMAPN